MIATKMKNVIVQYQGGGYDGCIWEWNYAYFDAEGNFHSILSTGCMGRNTEDELMDILPDDTTDIYELDENGEVERFGRETPISHLLGVGQWLAKETEVKLTVVCEECQEIVEVTACDGEGAHGIGGIMLEHDRIICAECHSVGTCSYCGKYVGVEHIDGESGYCTGAADGEQWCKEQHWDEWND